MSFFNVKLSGQSSRIFKELGVDDFDSACEYVKNLKYERISDKFDPLLVLREKRGTCSSKHALLKMLADENELDLELRIGIYKMTPDNTLGIDKVFPAEFEYIPEAHAYLFDGEERMDMTRKDGSPLKDEDILKEIKVSAEELIQEKEQIHKGYIDKWAEERGIDSEFIWEKREECIKALASA